ncbi:MAG: site-2 protease family protein [Chloroflexi bacterium]|nr:site-2 protease family protein [Chloroflexota bacterium]
MTIDPIVRGRLTEQLQHVVADYFAIDVIDFDHTFPPYKFTARLSGRFLTPTDVAYDPIAARAQTVGSLVFFREEEGQPVIYVAQGELPQARPNYRLAVILFIATLASVFITFGLKPDRTIDWGGGLSYALPLMTILLAHELGHFFVARRNHIQVSPPYFIPLPIISLGTLGAVIMMLAPPKNRRNLLQMAAAGPIAGLIFALPILWIGLSHSPVQALPVGHSYLMEGNSILYAVLKWLIHGQWLPSAAGMDVTLNNMAFAGWVGLLVTALNLIPAGQLDGGHALFTLFGKRVRVVTYVLIAGMMIMSFRYVGWLIWAALLYFLGRRYAVPLDDLTPLDAKHKALAVFLLILAVLLFTPIPFTIVNP